MPDMADSFLNLIDESDLSVTEKIELPARSEQLEPVPTGYFFGKLLLELHHALARSRLSGPAPRQSKVRVTFRQPSTGKVRASGGIDVQRGRIPAHLSPRGPTSVPPGPTPSGHPLLWGFSPSLEGWRGHPCTVATLVLFAGTVLRRGRWSDSVQTGRRA
jgi:hypothetical protein